MERMFAFGVVMTLASLVGYVAGVWSPYPGRELSLIGVMIGITLASVGTGGDEA